MPDLAVQDRYMGAWQFLLDEEVQVTGVRVSVQFEVVAVGTQGEFLTRGGQDFDVWPLLTQGQRNQLQNIVDKVLEAVEEV